MTDFVNSIPDWVFTAAWLAMGVWFLIFEGLAIWRAKGDDTLSEHIWDWFKLRGPKRNLSRAQGFLRFGFLAFWAWLTVHFLTGGSFL